MPRLSLLYQALIWTLLPFIGVIGFSYLQIGYTTQQLRQNLEQQLHVSRTQVYRALSDQLETVNQLARLVAESREVIGAFEQRQTDWLYQWGKRFADSDLLTEIFFIDRDGILLACGHDEFRFNEDMSGDIAFRLARTGEPYAGMASFEGIPSFSAAIPVYRFESMLMGVVIVNKKVSTDLLARVGNTVGSRIGIELDQARIGHFPPPREAKGAISTRFELGITTLSGTPVAVELSGDTAEDAAAVKDFQNRLIGFSTLAMVLFAITAILVMGRILRPVRELRAELRAISRGQIHLQESLERLDRFKSVRNEVGGIAESAIAALQKLHQTQQQLENSENRAQAASRAKTEFLSNMSHEIRTPLNAILGFTDLLRRTRLGSREQRYVDTVHKSGEALGALVNDILDLARIEAGKLEIHKGPMRLRSLLEEQRDLFETRVHEKGLEFVLEVDPALPQVLLLDEVRLRQVLINLVGNAVKFTERGHVKLLARLVEKRQNRVDLLIQVEDSGPGIPERDQRRIFGLFEQQNTRTARKHGGSGLGLAICMRLAELMDARLTLASEAGRGSCFSLRFSDVSLADEDLEDLINPPEIARRFGTATLLVVDDVSESIEFIQEYFRDTQIRVVGANDGTTGIRLARELLPNLILMDVRMPGMSGYQAARILKQDPLTSGIPLVAATASVLDLDDPSERRELFDGFLPKPLRPRQIEQELSKHLPHSIQVVEADESRRFVDYAAIRDEMNPETAAGIEAGVQQLRISGSLRDARSLATALQESGHQALRSVGDSLDRAVDEFDIGLIEQIIDGLSREDTR